MYLFKGCRLTLIKSMLSSLLTYFSLFTLLLAGMANWMEKFRKDFLWGGLGDEFKFHLDNENNCSTPLYLGVWEIRS